MAVVMDKDKAMLRQQGQREADTDSRGNNQIKLTVAAAAVGGDGRHISVMAGIDNGGDGG
jgi:hypothetical protein